MPIWPSVNPEGLRGFVPHTIIVTNRWQITTYGIQDYKGAFRIDRLTGHVDFCLPDIDTEGNSTIQVYCPAKIPE